MSLPLDDGSPQAVGVLAQYQVTSNMEHLELRRTLECIKGQYQEIKELQHLEVSQELGGEIDIILGLGYNKVYPEVIHTLPNGLQILRSKFLQAVEVEVCCVGGPLGVLSPMVQNIGVKSTMRCMSHLITD